MVGIQDRILYWGNMPRFTSSSVKMKLNQTDTDVEDTYTAKKALITNGTSARDLNGVLATIPTKNPQNIGAARLDLMTEAREHGLGDGTEGTKKSKIKCYYTNNMVSLSELNVDHFHPSSRIIEFLDEIDDALRARTPESDTFVRNMKSYYPKNESLDWRYFLKKIKEHDGERYYKIKNTYRMLMFNNPENLWFITGDVNKSWGNALKIPEDGVKIEESILGSNPMYGGDFLSKLGTISRTHRFTATNIIKHAPIHVTNIFINPITGRATQSENAVYGIGLVARNWFTYRCKILNTPQKALSTVRHEVSELARRLDDMFISIEDENKGVALTDEESKTLEQDAIHNVEAEIEALQKRLNEMKLARTASSSDSIS